MLAHITAHFSRIEDPTLCDRLWSVLHQRLPDVAAAALMPTHVHILGTQATRDALGHLQRAHHRTHFVTWRPPAPIEWLPDQLHTTRMFRYVWLNPCRAGLVGDPLAWRWSTYQDALELRAAPWVPAADATRHIERRFRRPAALHAYVSADSSVHTAGTPLPAVEPRSFGLEPLAHVAAAVSAVAGPLREPLQRRAFVQLARGRGHSVEAVAEVMTASRATAFRDVRCPLPEPLLSCALRALGDARLRDAGFRQPPWLANRLVRAAG